MEVTIDKNSGYCFGVEYAIQMAEDFLKENETLYCLGDIVHNSMEVERLHQLGLRVIDHAKLKDIKDCRVLLRAHGEPPETYRIALENNIELIDASCPVVLKLQNRVKSAYDHISKSDGQIVIYGQKGHAEVIGLNGQTGNHAIVVTGEDDLQAIDFSKPVELFSQTTKPTEGFYKIAGLIESQMLPAEDGKVAAFDANDSICRQVSNREPQLKIFAKQHDVIVFVSGKKSSNGKALFAVCHAENASSYFVENETEVSPEWFDTASSVGICGATSTPMWLMEQVAAHIQSLNCVSV